MSLSQYSSTEDMFKDRGTGSHEELNDYEEIERQFAHYTIKLRLTADGRFVDILEIKLNRDLADYKQKAASSGTWDISDYQIED